MNFGNMIKRSSRPVLFVFDPGRVFVDYRDYAQIPLWLAVVVLALAACIIGLFALAIYSFIV